MAAASSAAKDGDTQSLRDSYVPLFSNQPTDYREYRKRLTMYHKKMLISKRSGENQSRDNYGMLPLWSMPRRRRPLVTS